MVLNLIEIVFFVYTFIGLYMLSLFIIIYLQNKDKMFSYPAYRPEKVSIVMPCFNAERTIGKAIESLVNLDYPEGMIEVIVVDDKSKDNTVSIVRNYTQKYSNVRLIVNERNSGAAAEPTNKGILAARYDYIAVADDDSTPDRDALKKMLGFLQENPRVAAVTCSIMVDNPKTFLQKLQAIEYGIIAFSRKLLDMVDAVYVTPGPFALYRKKDLIKVGLFDTKNFTQDIEIVWRLLSKGYLARMCLDARVHTDSPPKFKGWFKQRIRWNIGGAQTLLKYRNMFFRGGMLGNFVVPFFSISLFIGLFGMGLFVYLWSRKLLVHYLSTSYSIYASSTILSLQDLTFSPSLLNFFGISLFLLGIFFTLFGLGAMKELKKKHINFLSVGFYMTLYLILYPVILIVSFYKLARGNYTW